MSPLRILAFAGLTIVLAFLGWQVVWTTRADRLADADSEAALRLDPDHPRALLLRARLQLARGDDVGATTTARRVLELAPGQGEAFASIALAADKRHATAAEQLLEIAAQRAPRTAQVRARLATLRLQAGDVEGALAQLDALLRFEPEQGERFFPVLAVQSTDPRFAEPMAATLARNPPWRRDFLRVLNAKAPPAAIDNLYAQLQAKGGLSADESRSWIDGLIAKGRWRDAFSAWSTTTSQPAPGRIPAVRNGGFEGEMDGVGFSWRNEPAPGVFTDIEADAGSDGSPSAHLHFIGLPAPRGNLRQALLLSPGRYRLSFRARAEGLRSDRGLTWGVRCDRGNPIASSAPLDGNFDWQTLTVEFEVSAKGCEGQWLELGNPAVRGAQQVEGDLWIDDVAITPARAH